MKNTIKKGLMSVAICLLSVQPGMACWDNTATNALKIKHLNTMLMATALRCRNTESNFLPSYNAFVQKHNMLLGQQNSIVRVELAKTLGNGGAIERSDNLSVGYANTYGAGHPGMNCAQLKVLAVDIANQPSNVANFSLIADLVLLPSEIPGNVCTAEPIKIAAK